MPLLLQVCFLHVLVYSRFNEISSILGIALTRVDRLSRPIIPIYSIFNVTEQA